ncbi:MAG TPA: sulfotransferase family protein [Gammaproteobacteria bacterium]|nr:sulfotransferase family protein [Gammaproteobacteria bacterium]
MPAKNILTRSLRRKADALLAGNDLPAAAELYQRICRSDRGDLDARVMLGVVQLRQGQPERAAECCREALKIDAGHALAHHVLGSALEQLDQLEAAVSEFRAALRLRPAFANAHLFLGRVLARLGQNEEAERCHLEALELEPGLVAAMASLGSLYLNTGRPGEAERWLRKGLAIAPAHAAMLTTLGQALGAQGKDAEAVAVLESALRADPDSLDALLALGSLQSKCGDYDRALECYRRVSDLQPGNEYAIGARAQLLERRGEIEAAFGLLRPLVETGSTHISVALPFAELALQLDRGPEAIELLERALPDHADDPQGRIDLHYRLGKLLDRGGEYDRAFEHYRRANRLSAGIVAASTGLDGIDAQARRVLERSRDCDAEFWKSLPRAANGSECPVFVVGMPRSGTTLVEQILASHARVYGAGELTAMENIARSLCSGAAYRSGYPACLEGITAQRLEGQAQRHLRLLASLAGGDAERVVDKCPHNYIHLGLVSVLFPRARVVHVSRDPRDTACSIYFQAFTPLHAYACDLQAIGRHYHVYRQLMAYWEEVLDIDILHLRYEDLVAEPERHIRSLVDFCGLPWDPRCLEFHNTRRDVNTPSYGQVRRPMYRGSVGRWRHYRPHLEPLLQALEEGQP